MLRSLLLLCYSSIIIVRIDALVLGVQHENWTQWPLIDIIATCCEPQVKGWSLVWEEQTLWVVAATRLRQFDVHHDKDAPKERDSGMQPPPPPNHQNQHLKNIDFIDILISKVLRGLHFSRNQALKSADNQYIRILKNK
jgi:hypothetical protein